MTIIVAAPTVVWRSISHLQLVPLVPKLAAPSPVGSQLVRKPFLILLLVDQRLALALADLTNCRTTPTAAIVHPVVIDHVAWCRS